MRSAVRSAFLLNALGAIAVVVACGGGDETSAEGDSVPDAGQVPPVRAGAETNGPDGSSSAASTMRFAHLAPESGPIDFCYQEALSGSLIGPVLGGPGLPAALLPDGDAEADAEADADAKADADAGPRIVPAVSYGTVTKYLGLSAAGTITIAIVAAGATSCANPLARGDITLDPGKLSTVALFSRPGDGGAELEVASFTDDRATESDKIRVRVISAVLGGSLAVRASTLKTTVLADRVEPRRAASASDPANVDGLGYVTARPIPPPSTIAIGPATTDGGADAGFEPWLSQPSDLLLTGGSLHTAFLLPGDGDARFAVLWCADTTTEGDRTVCRWLP